MADLGAVGLVSWLGIVGWLFAAGGLSLIAVKLHNGKTKGLGSRRVIFFKWAALTALALFNWSFSLPLLGMAVWVFLLAATAALSGLVGYKAAKSAAFAA